MNLSVFLVMVSFHISVASKESKLEISNAQEFSKSTSPIDAQISKGRKSLAAVEDHSLQYDEKIWKMMVSKFRKTLKKIEQNPKFGLVIYKHRFAIQLSIPCGDVCCYGSEYDHETARKAVLFIAEEYKKSLEARSPATKEDLKQKYDAKFSRSQEDITIWKFENTMKHIEQNPNFGLQKYNTSRYYINVFIPIGKRHIYGSHQDHATARKAVLMIAEEYKKSLEANSPATKEDLQQKYDAMFPQIKQQNMLVKLDDILKKTEQNPNFGLQFNGNRIYVHLHIPIGKRYMYGRHDDLASARKAVQMIVNEYIKTVELGTPATFNQVKLKYDAMFGEAQEEVSKCNFKENKLDIENDKNNLLMIFQMTSQKPNRRIGQNDLTSSEETHETPNGSNNVYQICRIWNTPDDEPKHDFYLGGYFKVMSSSDVFWVNTIKKVDGRLSGYYAEYGGCRGWLNLECIDSTDFDGPKEMNETLKRKREKSESISESEESTRGSDRSSEQLV